MADTHVPQRARGLPEQLWRAVDDPSIDRGLRARMAKGFDATSVFEDTLEAVLDWIIAKATEIKGN